MYWIIISILLHLVVLLFIPLSFFYQEKPSSSDVVLTYGFKEISIGNRLSMRRKKKVFSHFFMDNNMEKRSTFKENLSPLNSGASVSIKKMPGNGVFLSDESPLFFSSSSIYAFCKSPQTKNTFYSLKIPDIPSTFFSGSLSSSLFLRNYGKEVISKKVSPVCTGSLLSTRKKLNTLGNYSLMPLKSSSNLEPICAKGKPLYLTDLSINHSRSGVFLFSLPGSSPRAFSCSEKPLYLNKGFILKKSFSLPAASLPQEDNLYSFFIPSERVFTIKTPPEMVPLNFSEKLSLFHGTFLSPDEIVSYQFSFPEVSSYPSNLRKTVLPPSQSPMLPPGEGGERIISPLLHPRASFSIPEIKPSFSSVFSPSLPLFNTEGTISKVKVFPLKKHHILVAEYLREIINIIQRNKKYPSLARKKGEKGRVGIIFTLSHDGKVMDVKVVSPSRYSELNKAAEKLISGLSPFPPFPAGMDENTITLKMEVIYELEEKQ